MRARAIRMRIRVAATARLKIKLRVMAVSCWAHSVDMPGLGVDYQDADKPRRKPLISAVMRLVA